MVPISDIFVKLSTLDIRKGPELVGIPPFILKVCSFILARPLHKIFSKFF